MSPTRPALRKSWVRDPDLSPSPSPPLIHLTTSAPPPDAFYVDPLGPQMERPKTGAKKRAEDDDFEDEELGDDLLPE